MSRPRCCSGDFILLKRETPAQLADSPGLLCFILPIFPAIIPSIMSDKWDFYLSTINDKPASLFVDVGIATEAPLEGYGVRLAVLVRQLHPRADGLTTQEEADRLWLVEDALLPAVKEWGAIYVGRITTDGRRDFIFYAATPVGFDAMVSIALAAFGCEFETQEQPDGGWKFYFDILYPTPMDWQRISNRHVLDRLKRAGDDLSKPRRIFHWLYFSASADRERCAESARAKGFGARILQTTKKPAAKNPLGLQLHRIDSVAPRAIDAVSLDLFTLAKQNAGEYDGWETQIVKAGREPIDDTPKD
jgi:regulator of RNase E activity RraB